MVLAAGEVVEALLDGGAGVSTIPDELLSNIINTAYMKGLEDTPEWPVFALERWPSPETVNGIKIDEPIQLIGAVVLRIGLIPADAVSGRKLLYKKPQTRTIAIRAKIFERGKSER